MANAQLGVLSHPTGSELLNEDAVAVYDAELKLIAWNAAYSQLAIVPNQDAQLGQTLEETYRIAAERGMFGDGEPHELVKLRLERVRSRFSTVTEQLAIGESVIEMKSYPLAGGGVVVAFSDITRLRQTESKLIRAENLEALARVTGGFAHDLKNVLTAVINNMSVARQSNDLRYIDLAIDAAMNGAELAKSALALTRQSDETPTPFEVTGTVNNTVRWLQRGLRGNVRLTTQIDSAPCWVLASESRFRSSLLNLVLNSQDALPNGGDVTIDVTSDLIRQCVRVTVADDGQGMSDELLCKANEPFFTTKDDAGTGIGLFDVCEFVRQTGGEFRVASELGVGTSVTMEFPATMDAHSPNTPEPAEERWDQATRLDQRVLLVEDDVAVSTSLQKYLQLLHVSVVAVTSGEEAVRLVRLSPDDWDAVITGHELSGAMTGLQLEQHLREAAPTLPMILCSGDVQLPPRVLHLAKPVDPRQLVAELQRIKARSCGSPIKSG